MKSLDLKSTRTKLCGACFAVVVSVTTGILGQTPEPRVRNNPYSPSPNSKPKQQTAPEKPAAASNAPNDVSFVMQKAGGPVADDNRPMIDVRPSIAQATFKIAKEAEAKSLPPTEIYKIGVGDVLFVSLKNSPQGSGYYTVRSDGTIDYPLAGDNVVVGDQPIDAAEEIVASGITLFASPQVEIKVRQYASHKITVSGLVESAGEKNLQREAMPLFAIKAEAVVSPKATKVSINRGTTSNIEIYDLRDPKTDSVLVFPGNSVEFTGDSGTNAAASGSFFIGGEIVSGGQKDLTNGLTLYQAIVISGGTKGEPKKAIIRRKNEKGMFNVIEHNLRSIKDGKAMDPFLAGGDVIEIKN